MKSAIEELSDNIIACFKEKKPKSIIIGGSDTTSENAILYRNEKRFFLSDIDLVCIHPDGYSEEESQHIFSLMLQVSKNAEQANPYFHIGLKLRSPEELQLECHSLYFKELSTRSSTLIGKPFSYYFSGSQRFGFTHEEAKARYRTLYNCGLTRLWCNALFFPLQLLSNYDPTCAFRIWYNYFYARGAMDWINWNLLENKQWFSGYYKRFETWCSLPTTFDDIKCTFKACLDNKIGVDSHDVEQLFPKVNHYAYEIMQRFASQHGALEEKEFKLLYSMNEFIHACLLKNEQLQQVHVQEAHIALEKVIGLKITQLFDDPKQHWGALRKLYSDFRFERSARDCYDHNVYTNHFLKLGSPV